MGVVTEEEQQQGMCEVVLQQASCKQKKMESCKDDGW
jgi:hypothetical protein